MNRMFSCLLALAVSLFGPALRAQAPSETDFVQATSMEGYRAGVSAWLQFRGDLQNTGVSHSRRPNYGEMKLAWKYFANAPLTSTPAVAAGRVIAAGEDGMVHAIDAETGRSIWRTRCGSGKPGEGIVISSPMILDGRVYVGTKMGRLHALDFATGEEQFVFEAKDPQSNGEAPEIYASPKGDTRGVVFATTGGFVYCVDPKTGALRWKQRLFRETGASAAVLGNRVYITGKDRELRELSYDDGSQFRSVKLPGTTHATPCLGLGFAYLITGSSETVAIDLIEGKIAWTGEATTDDKLCAAVANGIVYFPLGQFVYAHDGVSGKKLFQIRADHKTTPICIVGEEIVFGGRDGFLRIHNAKTGAEVKKIEVGEGMVAGPVVVDGTIYVATDVNSGVHVFAFR